MPGGKEFNSFPGSTNSPVLESRVPIAHRSRLDSCGTQIYSMEHLGSEAVYEAKMEIESVIDCVHAPFSVGTSTVAKLHVSTIVT